MKTIHFHIGPHRTGTAAIQKMISSYPQQLEKNHGLYPVQDPSVQRFAISLQSKNRKIDVKSLEKVIELCHRRPGDCLISCQEISGVLPGQSKSRKPYPRLHRNLKTIQESFSDFRCKFYFFIREPGRWIASAYAEVIRNELSFSSLDEYKSFLRNEELWDGTLANTRQGVKSDLIEIPYEETVSFSSEFALLNSILGQHQIVEIPHNVIRTNQSPATAFLRLYEVINRSDSSQHAKNIAKKQLAKGYIKRKSNNIKTPDWPVRKKKPVWLSPNLDPLWHRGARRVHQEEQPNLLPDPQCDLAKFRLKFVESPVEIPSGGRAKMENQFEILKYRFRELPETTLLLGLTISYLRRDTAHTKQASIIFQRLWDEEFAILLSTLSTRWLISTFQTFLDHGINEAQKIIGSSAYFFTNILKAYEAERALDGLQPDSIYPNTRPSTKYGFAGLDRFLLGETDLMLNTNALLLELASQDERVGRVVQEFLLRLKNSKTMFSRMDQSRIKHEIDVPLFSNCWSFFEDPRVNDQTNDKS